MKQVIMLVALAVLLLAGCTPKGAPTKEYACTTSGGFVSASSCCLSAADFPNSCLIGACGCSPENSHEIKVCSCPEEKCFDGTGCVAR